MNRNPGGYVYPAAARQYMNRVSLNQLARRPYHGRVAIRSMEKTLVRNPRFELGLSSFQKKRGRPDSPTPRLKCVPLGRFVARELEQDGCVDSAAHRASARAGSVRTVAARDSVRPVTLRAALRQYFSENEIFRLADTERTQAP